MSSRAVHRSACIGVS